MNKRLKIIIFIIFLSLLILGGVYYFFYYGKVNYLIPGVPYYGVYNLFFRGANTSEISSILDILGYWGDERFSVPDLVKKFPPDRFATTTELLADTLKSEIKNFFEENGYETSGWFLGESTDAINGIKQFVNPKKKVPVIILTKRAINKEGDMFLFISQAVIGVFDGSQKLVIHDYHYGNNYEISYSNFTTMFQSGTGILAIWPSDKIESSIKGPDYTLAYPQRAENMDEIGDLLAKKYLPIIKLWQKGDYTQSVVLYKEFFNDPNFKYLPPAVQIMQLCRFAEFYIYLDEPDEAIRIINEQVLPINKDLIQTSEGWFGVFYDEVAAPYYVLSLAYLKEGKLDLAIENYKKMKSISAIMREKAGENNYLGPLPIGELEKEISETEQ